MTTLLALLALVLHIALLLAAAPLVAGAAQWVRARLLGRTGPPMRQPWRDLARKLRKQPVQVEGATWLGTAAPAAQFATVLAAAALVPSFTRGMTTAPLADLLAVVGLLAMARVIGGLAALDAGGAADGIGASRDAALSAFAAPAVVIACFALALPGGTRLEAIAAAWQDAAPATRAALALLFVVLAGTGVALASADPIAGRPAELGGGRLALLDLAEALARLVWMSLLALLFLPAGIAEPGAMPGLWLIGLLAWAAKITVLVLGEALCRTAGARGNLAELLALAGIAALFAALLLLAGQVPA